MTERTGFSVDVQEFRQSRGVIALVWWVAVSLISAAYLHYAWRAGFYLDDFYLTRLYESGKYPWWDYNQHFGRIFTRYIYWSWLPPVFGNKPFLYLLFNFAFVIASAWAFGRFLAAFSGAKDILKPAIVCYLLATTTLHAYSWISTFQHIGAHLFVFLFLFQMVSLADRWDNSRALLAFGLFVAGVLSNQLAIVAPAAAFAITCRQFWGNRKYFAFACGLVLLSGLVFIAIKLYGDHPVYAQQYLLERVTINLDWYTEKLEFGKSVLKYLVAIIIVLALIKRTLQPLLLLSAVLIAFLPFAFLVTRQNTYFLHLSYVFLIGSLLLAVFHFRSVIVKFVGTGLILAIVLYSSLHHIDTFKQPLGADVRREVGNIAQSLEDTGNTICVIDTSETPQLAQWHRMLTTGYYAFNFYDPENHYLAERKMDCAEADYRLYVTQTESAGFDYRLEPVPRRP